MMGMSFERQLMSILDLVFGKVGALLPPLMGTH